MLQAIVNDTKAGFTGTARPRDRLLPPSLGIGEPKPLPRLSDPVSRRVPSGRGWGWGLLRHQAGPLQPALTVDGGESTGPQVVSLAETIANASPAVAMVRLASLIRPAAQPTSSALP